MKSPTNVNINYHRLPIILGILLLTLVLSKAIDFALANDSVAEEANLISSMAISTVYTSTNDYNIYFPIIHKPFVPPVLFLQSAPNKNNARTVEWTGHYSDTQLTGYVLEADNNLDFVSPDVWNLDKNTTSVSHTPSTSYKNLLFYRVRPVLDSYYDVWSNLLPVVGNYRDDFNNTGSNWDMRRQDTDDVDNNVFYDGGQFVLRILGRYDYVLASPVMPAPQPPYRIDTKVRWTGVDNLHTYGIVFGGDWNGQPCPNSDFSSCFNHYYRLMVLWSGSPSKLKMQLKRIDFHDGKNQGRGATLIDWRDVGANKPPREFQIWSIEVNPNGQIKVYINGNLVGTASDSTFIDDRYFGVLASTNEYSGLRAEFDWFQVDSLLD